MALNDATSSLACASGGSIFIIPLKAATAISSAAKATFTTGKADTDTITAAGTPAATFTESGKLPSGVTLSPAGLKTTARGSGYATINGTPPASAKGHAYTVHITAKNATGTSTQTLTVRIS